MALSLIRQDVLELLPYYLALSNVVSLVDAQLNFLLTWSCGYAEHLGSYQS